MRETIVSRSTGTPSPFMVPGYSVLWVEGGELTFRSETRTITARPGRLYLQKPLALCTFAPAAQNALVMVRIELDIDAVHAAAGDRFADVERLFAGADVDGAGLDRCVSSVGAWIEGLLSANQATRWPPVIVPHSTLLIAVREHVKAHVTTPMSLETLAAGGGRRMVARLFQRVYGVTPHAYHAHLRMAEARSLLRAGVAPASVAQARLL